MTRFFELSKSKQITLIVYCAWLLFWLCILIANVNSYDFVEGYVLPFFVCTVVIPFIVLGGLYIYKILRETKACKNPIKNEASCASQSDIQSERRIVNSPVQSLASEQVSKQDQLSSNMSPTNSPQIISSELLLDFARHNGKMQVVNKKNTDGGYERYCQFTSADGKTIRVEFAKRIGVIDSKEISENKYMLAVNKLADGTYFLDFLDGKKI